MSSRAGHWLAANAGRHCGALWPALDHGAWIVCQARQISTALVRLYAARPFIASESMCWVLCCCELGNGVTYKMAGTRGILEAMLHILCVRTQQKCKMCRRSIACWSAIPVCIGGSSRVSICKANVSGCTCLGAERAGCCGGREKCDIHFRPSCNAACTPADTPGALARADVRSSGHGLWGQREDGCWGWGEASAGSACSVL